MKRLLALLLVLTMMVGFSAAAFASEDAPEQLPAEEVPVEEVPIEEVPVEEASVEEAPVEEAPIEEPVPDAEEAPVTDGEEIIIDEVEGSFGSYTTEPLYDNDTLLAGYLNNALGDDLFTVPDGPVTDGGTAAGDRLTGENKNLYTHLKEAVQRIAAGQDTSAIIELPLNTTEYTAEALGLSGADLVVNDNNEPSENAVKALRSVYDINLVIDAVLADCPYDMYWYANNCSYSVPGYGVALVSGTRTISSMKFYQNSITIYMSIDTPYSSGKANDYTVTGASAISSAVATAKKWVSDAANKTDYEKLVYYRTQICDAVSYNNAAAEGTYTSSLNPWNLIWVFDGDSSTNVVCEGYAKAFQYLCDLTDWKDDSIYCLYVSGKMDNTDHGWNIVHMPNDKNYLVDVTNCDTNTIGAPDKLFMVGGSGSVTAGYNFCNTQFNYSLSSANNYVNMLDLYTTDMLTLAASNYDPVKDSLHTHNYTSTVTTEPNCTEKGLRTYTCTICSDSYTEDIAATGHSWNTGEITKAATCSEKGVKTYTCSVCKATKTEDIPATGNHTWDTGEITKTATCTEKGTKTYTCSVCKQTKTEDIPATGHSWNAGEITKTATCTEKGVKTYTCSACKQTKTEDIPATGHSWNAGEITKAATCTEKGVKTYTCSACKATKTEDIPAAGHSWDAGVITVQPTYTTTGTRLYTCKTCKTTYTETVAKLPVPHSSATGWTWYDGDFYYFNNDSLYLGWLSYGGSWYYLGTDGAMATGVYTVPGDTTYYFSDGGVMQSNCWMWKDGKFYYFGSDGRMVTSGWAWYGGSWYYFGADGAMATGVYDVPGDTTYYFSDGGALKYNSWLWESGNFYYFGSDGRMVTSGWVYYAGTWYYMDKTGAMATGVYDVPGDTTYYFSDGGAMNTSCWLWQNDKCYYFGSDGRMAKNSWIWWGTWYYVDKTGAMATGTVNVPGYGKCDFGTNGAWVDYAN